MSTLEYGKLILQKVSFDHRLFWKEYRKFRKLISREESNELIEWVKKEYNGQHVTNE